MTKMIAHGFKNKVEMIKERESLMSDEEKNNEKFFPRYIIVRKKHEEICHNTEWQGVVNEMISRCEKSIQRHNQTIF